MRGRLWLADLALVREDLDVAERWLEEARSLREGERWLHDPARPEIDFRRAQILVKRGEFAAAEPLLRESLEWHRREHGERDSRTLLAARELGRALERQGKYGEAEELVRRSLDVATS